MKKRYMYAVACSVLCGAQAMAQTAYDAVRYAGDELNGTARFVGMGGAMGALGADISVIGTNPAGIGLFTNGIRLRLIRLVLCILPKSATVRRFVT